MGVSINPVTLLELLLEKRFRNKQKVVEYLESIAKEADSLANVWEQVVHDLVEQKNAKIREKYLNELSKYHQPNAPYYTRLAHFYEYLSVAVGEKLENKWHDSMAFHLGSLLQQRELTLKEYRKSVTMLNKNPIFVADSNDTANLKNLAESVSVLQKEAAEIHVLAKTIRAL